MASRAASNQDFCIRVAAHLLAYVLSHSVHVPQDRSEPREVCAARPAHSWTRQEVSVCDAAGIILGVSRRKRGEDVWRLPVACH
jgi:hypothetical protein